MRYENENQKLIFKNKLIDLEQIYNFTCEHPSFSQKTNLDKIKLFCINIQDFIPKKQKIISNKNELIIKVNKREITIDIVKSPSFDNKEPFINWIFHKIFSAA